MEVESDFFRGGVFGSNEKDVINAYRLRRKLNSNVFKIAGTLKSYSDHKKSGFSFSKNRFIDNQVVRPNILEFLM